MEEKEEKKECCCSKAPLVLGVTACLLSIIALMKPSKNVSETPVNSIDTKIKAAVIDVIKNDPQTLIDAMGAGMVKKRDDVIKQLSVNVENNKTEIINKAFRLGSPHAKTSIICFFDPICEQCIEFQKSMVNILKSNKNVCFYILPVAVLGEGAEPMVKLYYQVHELDVQDSTKLIDFIGEITKENISVDRALSNAKINKDSLKKYEENVQQRIKTNRELLERMKISAIPAVFISKNRARYEIVQDHENIEQLIKNS